MRWRVRERGVGGVDIAAPAAGSWCAELAGQCDPFGLSAGSAAGLAQLLQWVLQGEQYYVGRISVGPIAVYSLTWHVVW